MSLKKIKINYRYIDHVIYFQHENYTHHTLSDDIAIFKLKNDAPLSPSIQIACLPDPAKGLEYPSRYDQDVWLAGLGSVNSSSSGEYPESLQNVKFHLYDGRVEPLCMELNYLSDDWSSILCAGRIQKKQKESPLYFINYFIIILLILNLKGDYINHKDSCHGDSGAAIYVKDLVNNKEKFIAVGIVSYGESTCGNLGFINY